MLSEPTKEAIITSLKVLRGYFLEYRPQASWTLSWIETMLASLATNEDSTSLRVTLEEIKGYARGGMNRLGDFSLEAPPDSGISSLELNLKYHAEVSRLHNLAADALSEME
jgi:hypothetical protein